MRVVHNNPCKNVIDVTPAFVLAEWGQAALLNILDQVGADGTFTIVGDRVRCYRLVMDIEVDEPVIYLGSN